MRRRDKRSCRRSGFHVFLFMAAAILVSTGFGCIPNTWEKRFSESDSNGFYCSEETSDGGFIAVGETGETGEFQPWLVKVDADGNEEWSRTFNMARTGRSVEETADGDYVLALSDYSYDGDSVLVKTDHGGTLLWSRIWEDTSFEGARQTDDGGVIIVGEEGITTNAWIARTDIDGFELWSRTFVGFLARDVAPLADGGFVVVGSFDYALELWILKLDAGGDEVWSHRMTNLTYNQANGVRRTSDGGCIIAGSTVFEAVQFPLFSLPWLIKLDADGAIEWDRTIVRPLFAFLEGYAVDEIPDGGYILAGMGQHWWQFMGDWQGILLKTDSTGKVKWLREFGTSDSGQGFLSVRRTTGGCLLAAGAYDMDGWLVKTDPLGLVHSSSD